MTFTRLLDKSNRKTQGQLSEEKTNPPKILNTTQEGTAQQTNHSSSIMFQGNSSRPKMLRQDPKNLSGIPCVGAHYIREAILTKDAIHPHPAPYEISYDNIREKISNFILENKHKLINNLDKTLKDLMTQALSEKDELNKDFFNSDSPHMINLSNTAYQVFTSMCDTNAELATNTNGHYESAKKTLASELSLQLEFQLINSTAAK